MTYRGGEVDTVADEVKGSAPCHVLPLSSGGPAWQQRETALVRTEALRHLSNIIMMVRCEGAQVG